MGWMSGLGQGLAAAGGDYADLMVKKRQMDIEQQNRAMQQALDMERLTQQNRANQLAEQQAEDARMRWMIGNTPAGMELSPEDAAARQKAGYGMFVKEGDIPGQTFHQAGPDFVNMGNVPGVGDIQAPPHHGFSSVPTQDSAFRRAEIQQAGAAARTADRLALQARIAEAKNRLDQAELEARKDNNAATQAARLQQIAVARAALQNQIDALNFNMDKAETDEAIRIYGIDSRAQQPDKLGNMLAMVAAMTGNQQVAGALATPQAPPTGAPTKTPPTKPVVPDYTRGGKKPPPAAVRKIPPPSKKK